MKKFILLFFVVFTTTFIKAQVTLDHTFTNQTVGFVQMHSTAVYYAISPGTNQVQFYNENYSLYKTTTITVPNGYQLYSVTNVSDKLFNTNSSIEFTGIFQDTLNYSGFLLKLFDENGVELQNFGNALSGAPFESNNDTKFMVHRYLLYPYSAETDIYIIGGTIVSLSPVTQGVVNTLPSYPNPANQSIQLTYSIGQSETSDLYIYDVRGNIIDQMRIGGAFNKIELDVSQYKPGIYFYKYNSESKQFVVVSQE